MADGITMNQRTGLGEISFRINLLGLAKQIADPAALNRIMRETMEYAERRAHSYVPYDTGELDRSIGSETNGVHGRLFATAEHAEPVEFGHRTRSGSFVPPQPYLRPAAEDAFAYLEKRVQRHIEEAVRKGTSSTGLNTVNI